MNPSQPIATFALIALAALTACGGKDKEDAAPAKATPVPAAEGVQAAPPAAAADPAPAMAAAGGHSAVPTVAEWNAVGEMTVRGSSALGCETKAVREWARISCRGEDENRGKPTGVTVNRGGNAEVFTFASGGIASLVYRFEEGTDLAATFTWENETHKLSSQWPRGAPKPPAYGEFQ